MLSATLDNFQAALLPMINVEQILRVLAVDRVIHNWDGPLSFYGGVNHNYYWYHDEESTKFLLIPWDMDKTFWYYDRYFYPNPAEGVTAIPGWNVKPADCSMRRFTETIGPPEEGPGRLTFVPPGCDNLINLIAANYFGDFVTIGNELLNGPFTLNNLTGKLDAYEAQIDHIMQNEPTITYDEWKAATAELRNNLPWLREHFLAHLAEGYIVE